MTAGFRRRELEWRRAHGEVLRAFAGQWVVLEGEEIVAHGDDPATLAAAARVRGIQVPYIFYVEPTRDKDVVRMGL